MRLAACQDDWHTDVAIEEVRLLADVVFDVSHTDVVAGDTDDFPRNVTAVVGTSQPWQNVDAFARGASRSGVVGNRMSQCCSASAWSPAAKVLATRSTGVSMLGLVEPQV